MVLVAGAEKNLLACLTMDRQGIGRHGTPPLLEKETGTTSRSHSMVDFESRAKALKELPPLRQIWTVKHTSGHCGVGKKMKQWRFWKTDKCPCCHRREDHVHVNRCLAASNVWKEKVDDLDQWLNQQGTEPYVRLLIVTALKAWQDGTPMTYTPIQAPLWESQQQIGWASFAMGWISVQWSVVQDEFYKSIGRKNTGRRWAKELIKKLWGISWDMWEHRNGILHDSENLRRSLDLNQDIAAHYQSSPQLLPAAEQHWFQLPLQELQRKSVQHKRLWVASVEAAVAFSSTT